MAKLTDKFFNRVIEGPFQVSEDEAKKIAQEGVYLVSDVKSLSNEVISQLKAGDIVVKHDNSGNHPYIVSFRGETGICLTYTDAYCVETQSYDKVGQNWVYNSEDKTIYAESAMENIVDKDGHERFIEGDIDLAESVAEGIEKIYGKWSLTGTHLLLVICFSIASGTVHSFGKVVDSINLPQWIKDKIIPVASQTVDLKSIAFYGSDLSTQNTTAYLVKSSNIVYINVGSITASADRSVRIAFDLLIDNE